MPTKHCSTLTSILKEKKNKYLSDDNARDLPTSLTGPAAAAPVPAIGAAAAPSITRDPAVSPALMMNPVADPAMGPVAVPSIAMRK